MGRSLSQTTGYKNRTLLSFYRTRLCRYNAVMWYVYYETRSIISIKITCDEEEHERTPFYAGR